MVRPLPLAAPRRFRLLHLSPSSAPRQTFSAPRISFAETCFVLRPSIKRARRLVAGHLYTLVELYSSVLTSLKTNCLLLGPYSRPLRRTIR